MFTVYRGILLAQPAGDTPVARARVHADVPPLPPAHVRSREESGKYFAGFTRATAATLPENRARSFRFPLSPCRSADPPFSRSRIESAGRSA